MSKNIGKRKSAKAKKRKTLFLLCFLIVAVGLVCGLSVTVFFPVKNIDVSGSNVYTAQEIILASDISQEDNLLILNESQILNNIQKTLPYIQAVELKRKLPDTAVLKVKDVDTYLYFTKDDDIIRTDGNLRIIPEGIDNAKYQLSVFCNWNTDDMSEFVVLENAEDADVIKQVLKACEENGVKVEILDMLNREAIKMRVDGRFEVLFGDIYDFSGKFSQLIAMINNIDKEKSGRIDLSDWSGDNTKGYFVEADVA